MTTPTPRSALTPKVMLATSLHAQPGVYAVLLGSGVSTGAGIPTGWGVVKELVRRVAAVANPEDPATAAEAATENPEVWWQANGGGEPLGYSSLLADLAPTAATRQGILASFFEPSDADREEGNRTPSAAHKALAKLVKRGTVRVILTTNFDRLMEQALETEGVSPQVISRPEAVHGMAPLAHAKATVVKLHGDYSDLGLRNTSEELGAYPAEWNQILDQILDQYGLVISGWSADWDTALVTAMERCTSRRYPLYWDVRSSKGATAQRLLHLRGGYGVRVNSADELFTGLVASIEALDHLAEPPLSTAMAVARLKRYLPDPERRIDLHDLLMDATDRVVEAIESQPLSVPNLDPAGLEKVYADHLRTTTPLLHLLVTGVWHDQDRRHVGLWTDVLQRLVSARTVFAGSFIGLLDGARHYPALLALRTMGLVAVRRKRDDVLIHLLTEVTWRNPLGGRDPILAAEALHQHRILDHDALNTLPRWEGTKWYFPASHMLRADLREVMLEAVPQEAEYKTLCNNYEYRVGLVQHSDGQAGSYRSASGEFVGEGQWTHEEGPFAEEDFRREAARARDDWPWWSVVGNQEAIDAGLLAYREVLEHYQRWG